jgi:hypothetical protein
MKFVLMLEEGTLYPLYMFAGYQRAHHHVSCSQRSQEPAGFPRAGG